MSLDDRFHRIRLILSDVDGVLTDGGLLFDNQGIESKQFHIHDGMGIRLWQRAGHTFGLITGRASQIVRTRAAELDIEIVRQGSDDKMPAVRDIIDHLGLTAEETCYIGDDLPDLAPVRHAGVGVAVADAVAELRDAADYVTQTPGGRGALREVIELALKAQHRWDDIVRKFK
jgi:3-deoxy-D-manno-octulosonate 8-phosphate phosphatase (KDO 8-P phosphatase)